jgi:hypothetical protein
MIHSTPYNVPYTPFNSPVPARTRAEVNETKPPRKVGFFIKRKVSEAPPKSFYEEDHLLNVLNLQLDEKITDFVNGKRKLTKNEVTALTRQNPIQPPNSPNSGICLKKFALPVTEIAKKALSDLKPNQANLNNSFHANSSRSPGFQRVIGFNTPSQSGSENRRLENNAGCES